MTTPYTFGLDTFGDRGSAADGTPLSHAQTIRNVAAEGVRAEQAGVDFFGIGEHHTEYFPMPAGDVVLAAIAARTERIRLGSAVTVLRKRRCSPSCSGAARSPGTARPARPCCTRTWCRTSSPARSRPGSASAATRSP